MKKLIKFITLLLILPLGATPSFASDAVTPEEIKKMLDEYMPLFMMSTIHAVATTQPDLLETVAEKSDLSYDLEVVKNDAKRITEQYITANDITQLMQNIDDHMLPQGLYQTVTLGVQSHCYFKDVLFLASPHGHSENAVLCALKFYSPEMVQECEQLLERYHALAAEKAQDTQQDSETTSLQDEL